MNRAKLIKNVASQLSLNEIEVGNFIGSIFDSMTAVLRKGKNINIPEFGKFIVREKVTDGNTFKFVSFSPSKKFADEINSNFSDLSPVLTKALNLNDFTEIKITETDGETAGLNFIDFVFDDVETEIQLEVKTPAVLPETEHRDPAVFFADKITEEPEISGVPYLIPVMSALIHPYTPESGGGSPEEIIHDPEQVRKDEFTLPAPETKPEEPPETGTIPEKRKIDIIEEKIITEKEIILKDIEEYIKAKEVTEETRSEGKEDTEKETLEHDNDNYFRKANVFSDFDGDNNFAVNDLNASDIKPQNVFADEDITDELSHGETEKPIEAELEQNVFSDLEDFFRTENGYNTENETPKPSTGGIDTVSDSGNLAETKRTAKEKALNLKDHIDEQDLSDEILSMLVSREKAISELSKYGPEISSEPEKPETQEEPAEEIEPETIIFTDLGLDMPVPDSDTPIIKEELPEISFEKTETPHQDIFDEDSGSVYDLLNKRIEELEELSAKKKSIEEEIKQNIISPEMTIFEKLAEEKPPPVPEKPISAFPDIIIHDPGNKYEDKTPKSLNDALEDVELDGIIEHLEHPADVFEEKSYDDVFKPADIPFVPVSNPMHEIKKQRKLLKFLLYFFFVVIFSIMSFFLYKSILTPSRKAPVDTLGVKVNDSIASKINLVDTSFKKGTIILNEFEVERDGDIVYRQTDNGFIIQIARFDKYSEALKYVSGLDNKNIHAEIERIDLPLNVTEYRIIIGTFETVQEAKSYFKNSGMMLNFIKVLTPFKTTLSF